ncbi:MULTISPECIES: nitroreductase family protein [Clostridia]|uniref:nitroreductase family protein n=1 Tax=Clostridia TaxID=186801 RepID=UPI0029BFEE74|nr:nitroreductase family protein [Paraclostridium bifermentans]
MVRKRRSIRTYNTEEISSEIVGKLNDYINEISGPFKENITFKILDSKERINGARLGTYGVIKGATKFIVAKVKEGQYSLEELGYEMESLVLYATSMGLGTCWIGGTFKKGQFAKAMELREGEILPIVLPIGYAKEKRSLIDKTMRFISKCDKRKQWNEIFYLRDFSCPLTQYCTLDGFKDMFENVRLAPSAVNKQPWRIVKRGNEFYFYVNEEKEEKKEDSYDIKRIDMGIAMCHFELTCKEQGIKGNFKVSDPNISDMPNSYKYIATWVKE